ncbi:MAG: hypothetical protein L3J46_08930, partial [Kangiellaceae bacterium]|nr:hypothetical protein [Kangiellaceae bacterium]
GIHPATLRSRRRLQAGALRLDDERRRHRTGAPRVGLDPLLRFCGRSRHGIPLAEASRSGGARQAADLSGLSLSHPSWSGEFRTQQDDRHWLDKCWVA